MKKWLAVSIAGIFAMSGATASASNTSCGATVGACVFASNSSSGAAIEGKSVSGSGVVGASVSGHGVSGTSFLSFGVVGTTTVNAKSASTARAGVYGKDASTNRKPLNSGVAGFSAYGYGVTGSGGKYGGSFNGGGGVLTTGIGVDPEGITTTGLYPGPVIYPDTDRSAVRTYGEYENNDEPFADTNFEGVGCLVYLADNTFYPQCGPTFTVDSAGNEYLAGTLNASALVLNQSAAVTTKRSNGASVTSYNARTSSPTLEDFGKASLRQGIAYVPIESVFSSTIDPSAGYMVFITPEGNSHGLYTSQLTARGFSVRENDGGRSSLTFDYRIVAHPADTKAARLPLAVIRKPLSHALHTPRRF